MQRDQMPEERLLRLYHSDPVLQRIRRHSGPEAARIFLCQLADERYSIYTVASLWNIPIFTVRLMRNVYTYERTTLREELGISTQQTLSYIPGKQEAV